MRCKLDERGQIPPLIAQDFTSDHNLNSKVE